MLDLLFIDTRTKQKSVYKNVGKFKDSGEVKLSEVKEWIDALTESGGGSSGGDCEINSILFDVEGLTGYDKCQKLKITLSEPSSDLNLYSWAFRIYQNVKSSWIKIGDDLRIDDGSLEVITEKLTKGDFRVEGILYEKSSNFECELAKTIRYQGNQECETSPPIDDEINCFNNNCEPPCLCPSEGVDGSGSITVKLNQDEIPENGYFIYEILKYETDLEQEDDDELIFEDEGFCLETEAGEKLQRDSLHEDLDGTCLSYQGFVPTFGDTGLVQDIVAIGDCIEPEFSTSSDPHQLTTDHTINNSLSCLNTQGVASDIDQEIAIQLEDSFFLQRENELSIDIQGGAPKTSEANRVDADLPDNAPDPESDPSFPLHDESGNVILGDNGSSVYVSGASNACSNGTYLYEGLYGDYPFYQMAYVFGCSPAGNYVVYWNTFYNKWYCSEDGINGTAYEGSNSTYPWDATWTTISVAEGISTSIPIEPQGVTYVPMLETEDGLYLVPDGDPDLNGCDVDHQAGGQDSCSFLEKEIWGYHLELENNMVPLEYEDGSIVATQYNSPIYTSQRIYDLSSATPVLGGGEYEIIIKVYDENENLIYQKYEKTGGLDCFGIETEDYTPTIGRRTISEQSSFQIVSRLELDCTPSSIYYSSQQSSNFTSSGNPVSYCISIQGEENLEFEDNDCVEIEGVSRLVVDLEVDRKAKEALEGQDPDEIEKFIPCLELQGFSIGTYAETEGGLNNEFSIECLIHEFTDETLVMESAEFPLEFEENYLASHPMETEAAA